MKIRVTVGLANHRPETVPAALERMYCHDALFLEEPPDPGFLPMLAGELSVDDYLQTVDVEYPEFSRRMLAALRRLHAAGKTIVQVEPYLETLLGIHERFASGQSPGDLPDGSLEAAVYAVERRASAALLDFYRAAAIGDFDQTVSAVKVFARADARRFVLRDGLRAAVLARRVTEFPTSYIEAGQIHVQLPTLLRRDLAPAVQVVSDHLMTAAVRRLGGRRSNLYGPGDRLTILYMLHPGRRSPEEDLLAARSLIYSKLIEKTEIQPGDMDPYPHTRNELLTDALVRRLSLADCRRLFAVIRRLDTAAAGAVVRDDLGLDSDAFSTRQPAR